MCGIVGYIGKKQAQEILIDGLSKLEYRGYDSAGIAVIDGDGADIEITKRKGRLANLEKALAEHSLKGEVGIGHTRWATHGEPSDINAHPQASIDRSIAVVHNGIIENYIELKEDLINKGHLFKSDTDTEVIAHLLHDLYAGDIVEALKAATERLRGSYALGILCRQEPDKIVAVRKDSPLIVGVGDGENFIASDIPAILKYTRDVYLLDNDEIAVLTKDKVTVLDRYGKPVGKQIFNVDWDPGDAEKGGYDHFMLKEIHEQPKAMTDTFTSRIVNSSIVLEGIALDSETIKHFDRIQIVACGTAYHAAMVGKHLMEKYARLVVETEVASEYRYKDPLVDDKTLLIVISQSGETADTLAAIRLAKEKGARILAITNVVGSSIAREADDVLYTNAGPEIAVASTKAYVTQVGCISMLAVYLAKLDGQMSDDEIAVFTESLLKTPGLIQKAIDEQENIKTFAYDHFQIHDMYFIGRLLDYFTCLEGSLKAKEISYIHSDAYASGELKHGPIALIDPGSVVVALCTQERVFDKMLSNIKEVKARGANVLAVAQEGREELLGEVDSVFFIPKMDDEITPIVSVVYLQLLAYYLAVARGCDVDKPKNLAKSVTVE